MDLLEDAEDLMSIYSSLIKNHYYVLLRILVVTLGRKLWQIFDFFGTFTVPIIVTLFNIYFWSWANYGDVFIKFVKIVKLQLWWRFLKLTFFLRGGTQKNVTIICTNRVIKNKPFVFNLVIIHHKFTESRYRLLQSCLQNHRFFLYKNY